MAAWNQYLIPDTLALAFQYLDSYSPSCQIVSGGTDLFLDIEQGRRPAPEVVLDVTRIPELNRLEETSTGLFLGAAVPLERIASSPLVHTHAQALQEAAGLIGGPQVRSVGTLGGNVAHGLPAADGTIALLALGARVRIASAGQGRSEDLEGFFSGTGTTRLQPGKDIILGFEVPQHRPGQASAFARVMRPQGVALPILNMSLWLEVRDGRVQAARLAAGPSGPVPRRAPEVEQFLAGRVLDGSTLEQAEQVLRASVHFRTSPLRATSAYRDHLAQVLFRKLLRTAWQRAEGETA